MSLDLLLSLTSAAALGLAAGFVFGRGTARDTRRIRDLEALVEGLEKEREQLLAELAAARDALRRKQEEFDAYRARVGDHFGRTSELLRDLTERYRGVYAHLAEGASQLCPEGFAGLAEGFSSLALGAGGGPEEAADAAATAENAPAARTPDADDPRARGAEHRSSEEPPPSR